MYIPFDELPSHSRIWIFMSDRPWTPSEVQQIQYSARPFLEDWTAHKQALNCSYAIFYNRFLVLAVDEQAVSASGCSIDKSVAFIRSLEQLLNCQLLNRMLLAFKKDGEINVVHRNEFEKLVEAGLVRDETIVFDNLVDSIEAFYSRWEVPFGKSWHKQLVG